MTTTEIWHARTVGEATCAALKKNGFDARFVETAEQAADYIESVVTAGASVGLGGSMTIRALELKDRLENKGARLLDHSAQGLSAEQKMDVMRAQLSCDVFLSSSNAITMKGELYNIDGNGNRVAALTFGPKKTIVVAGFNKIVRDLEEAEARLEGIASPMNNQRLGTGNPCTNSGVCMDCKSETRICRIYSVLKRRPSRSDFTVIIVGERLGY